MALDVAEVFPVSSNPIPTCGGVGGVDTSLSHLLKEFSCLLPEPGVSQYLEHAR